MNHFLEATPIAGILLCTVIVIVFLEITKKRRLHQKADLLNKLNAITTKNDLTITRWDTFGDHVLGYDETRRAVFFFYIPQNDILIFDIAGLSDCTLYKSLNGRTVYAIDLRLKSQNHPALYALQLYSRFRDGTFKIKQINQKAEKWKALIEDLIIEKKLSEIRNSH